jgi:aldose 1-epimerase
MRANIWAWCQVWAAGWLPGKWPPFDDQADTDQRPLHLWRPWVGVSDCYTLACMPLVPWSNRVSGGGFEFNGVAYPLAPNCVGEPYPIHGDGWLQP